MKKRAYLVVLAALVALMVASGASAKKADRYSAAKKAERHLLVKRAPDAKKFHGKPAVRQARRYGRHF